MAIQVASVLRQWELMAYIFAINALDEHSRPGYNQKILERGDDTL